MSERLNNEKPNRNENEKDESNNLSYLDHPFNQMPHHVIKTKSVFFDMDGVITNTMPDHFYAWKTILFDLGLDISRQEIYEREGQPGLISITEILTKYNLRPSAKEARAILSKKEILFKSIARTRFISGARSFLSKLNKFNVRCALVTGTSRGEVERILPAKMFAQFSVIITGDDVTNGKPDPEPYVKCAQAMRVPTRDVVVIENAPFGIRSAKGAGLRCYALETSLPASYLKKADRIFKSYNELQSDPFFDFLRS